jgi:hypothetical protein
VAPRALTALVAALVFAVASSPATAADCRSIDDFATGKMGEFPPGWKPRKDSGRAVYSIQEEGGRRFLHAAARGLGIQAAKEIDWDLTAHPMLAWSWRAIEFPKGADERQSSTNDSALAVYAVFKHTAWSVKSMKYIWSAAVPVGTAVPTSQGLTQGIILRSGAGGKGEWAEAKVNVLEDFKKYFKEDPPKAIGIAVLTDSDDTKSSAQGDYAGFRLCKN